MKLTKAENEKLTIALFKLGRMKPTIAIGEAALKLADKLDEEAARQEAAEKTAQASLPLETPVAKK